MCMQAYTYLLWLVTMSKWDGAQLNMIKGRVWWSDKPANNDHQLVWSWSCSAGVDHCRAVKNDISDNSPFRRRAQILLEELLAYNHLCESRLLSEREPLSDY